MQTSYQQKNKKKDKEKEKEKKMKFTYKRLLNFAKILLMRLNIHFYAIYC